MKTTAKQVIKNLIGGKKIRDGVDYTQTDISYEESFLMYGHLRINFCIERFSHLYEMRVSHLYNPTTGWVAPAEVELKLKKELFEIKETVLELLYRRRVAKLNKLVKLS